MYVSLAIKMKVIFNLFTLYRHMISHYINRDFTAKLHFVVYIACINIPFIHARPHSYLLDCSFLQPDTIHSFLQTAFQS